MQEGNIGRAYLAQQTAGYAQQQAPHWIVRIEGLAGGLHQLREKLEEFSRRLLPQPSGEDNASRPGGLGGVIEDAETQLRRSLELLQEINAAF